MAAAGPPITRVINKMDLVAGAPTASEFPQEIGDELSVSAKTGQGLDQLREHLKACVGYQAHGEGQFMARRRHLEALSLAQHHLEQGQQQLQEFAAGELLAEELRQAQMALGAITGEVTADDLLGQIFSSFCIGK